ncbi:NACHT protein [Huso huso]|uniref:NACHT protein n=1 Tax=Huso huso TaxID=61971 RepID=A0ABR0ZV17_HUSHU
MAEAETTPDILIDILDNLFKHDLKRLKRKLEVIESNYQCKNIPRGKLEDADVDDTVALMMGYYGEDAIHIVIEAMDSIGKKDLADKLRKKADKELEKLRVSSNKTLGYKEMYKEDVRKKYKKVRDYNSLPGEWVDFDHRYTRLLILKKHCLLEDKEHELISRGKKLMELMKKHRSDVATCIDVKDLFVANEKEPEPTTLVLQGPAGIGKTFTVQKIMTDWASNKLFQDRFDYVFHLNCRELNTMTDYFSLVDLILDSAEYLQPAIEEILSCPERLLFIIDGFDELKLSVDQADIGSARDVHARQPVATTLSRLLKRKILSKSTLLITTRPIALGKLGNTVTVERYAEILGFLEEEMKEYISRFYQNEQQALCVFNYIKEDETVFSMCFVPVVCWIVCSLMKGHISEGEKLAKSLKTTTQIFVHFVNKLLEHHCLDSQKEGVLQKLGSLALHGIKEQQILFEEEDLAKFSLDPVQSASAFFNKIVFKQDLSCKSMYHFLHLSIQELFAAMFCAADTSNAAAESLLNTSLTPEGSNLILVIQFLFGLTNKKTQALIQGYAGESSSALKAQLERWIPKAMVFYKNKPCFVLAVLHCLFEIQDQEFVKKAMKYIDVIDVTGFLLSKSDCLKIKYCIEQHDEGLKELAVTRCNMGEEEVKILLDILNKSQSIGLEARNLNAATIERLCTHISTHHSLERIELDIRKEEDGLYLYCATNWICQVSKLKIMGCVPEDFVLRICCLLLPKYKLEFLSLEKDGFSPETKKQLCDVLNTSQCRLTSLWLSENHFTDDCIPDICKFIKTQTSLEMLSVENNTFGDDDAKQFLDALNGLNLYFLSLADDNLTDECVEHLSSIIIANPSLVSLHLNKNYFTDKSVNFFIRIIQNCTSLKSINLEANQFSPEGELKLLCLEKDLHKTGRKIIVLL